MTPDQRTATIEAERLLIAAQDSIAGALRRIQTEHTLDPEGMTVEALLKAAHAINPRVPLLPLHTLNDAPSAAEQQKAEARCCDSGG